MITVQYFFSIFDVQTVFCFLRPRNRHKPFDVITDNAAFRCCRRQFLITVQLFKRRLFRRLRHAGCVNPLFQVGNFTRFAIFVSKFLLNRLHLLAQIKFFLRLFHRFFDTLIDAFLQIDDFVLIVQTPNQHFKTLADIESLKDFLFTGHFQRQMRSDHICQAARFFNIRNRFIGFVGHFFRRFGILLEMLEQ